MVVGLGVVTGCWYRDSELEERVDYDVPTYLPGRGTGDRGLRPWVW